MGDVLKDTWVQEEKEYTDPIHLCPLGSRIHSSMCVRSSQRKHADKNARALDMDIKETPV